MSGRFRAVAEAVVPEVAGLDDEAWADLVEVVEGALADRPADVRRQLLLFLRLVDWLSVPVRARRLQDLGREPRASFLRRLQDSRFLLLRRGVWGLRTLVFMGYYGRPEAREEIGYRARPGGWEAAEDRARSGPAGPR